MTTQTVTVMRSAVQLERLIYASDIGLPWKERVEEVACAANTGDSGWRRTYNNGKQDIWSVEYPKARYTKLIKALVPLPAGKATKKRKGNGHGKEEAKRSAGGIA